LIDQNENEVVHAGQEGQEGRMLREEEEGGYYYFTHYSLLNTQLTTYTEENRIKSKADGSWTYLDFSPI
jgi:hypothetical protein